MLAERRRGIDRERGAFVDQAVIATLEAEATRLGAELADADAETAALAPQQRRARAGARRALEEARAAFERDWADGVPALTGRAAEGRGELAALRSGVDRGAQELGSSTSRLATLEEKLARLEAEAARLRAEAEAAEEAERPLVEQAGGRRGSERAAPRSRSPTRRPRCAPPTATGTRGRRGRRR